MNARPTRPHSPPSGPLRAKRRGLLAGSALGAALFLAAGHETANAQAFRANPATVAGNVTYDRATPGVETVTVNTPTAIIHWRPFNPPNPNPYPFLPAGNVATFNSPGGNYVVLNRVFVTDPIRFDGTVLSRIGLAPDAPIGGTILFSSPGGIIVGSNALFDVGSLVLTSLDVADDGAGNFITPGGGFVLGGSFAGPFQPNAGVVVEPNARINALQEGSYVALIAPRVVQGGAVRVNGSAAYIGGDAVEFRVSQGLFDIVVSTGSDNATPVVHTGSTGGPASTGAPGDNHRINAVAVARNQAITMLLEGSIGYDPAVAVGVENGVIVLSAGYNVTAGAIDPSPAGGPPASIAISDAAFSSEVVGRATAAITATATAADPVSFADDVRLAADGALSFIGTNIPVALNLSLSGATIDIDSVTAGGTFDATSTGAATIDNAVSGSTLFVDAGTAATLGSLDAGSNIRVDAATIALTDGESVDDIQLSATGAITVGSARAGDDFQATAGGAFTAGSIVATGLGDDVEDIGTPREGFNVLIDSGGDLRLDDAAAPGRLELASSTGNVLSDGLLDVGTDFVATAALDVDIADVDATGAIDLTAGDDVDAANLTAGGSIAIDAVGDTTLTSATSGDDITILADGVVDIGSLDAFDNILVDPVSVTIGSVVAGGDLAVDATTFIDIGSADVGDDFTATAGTFFTAGTVIARGVKDSEGGAGPLGGGNIVIGSSNDLRLNNGDAADDIRLTASLDSVFGNGLLDAGSDIAVNAGGDIGLNDAIAGQSLDLDAGISIVAADLFAGGPIATDAVGDTTIATATSGGDITILADGVVTLGTLNAADNVLVDPISVTIASVTAGGDIAIDATTFIIVGAADAGDDFTAAAGTTFTSNNVIARGVRDSEGGIGALAGGNIVVDTGGDLILHNGNARDDIRLLPKAGSVFGNGALIAGSDIFADAPLGGIFINDGDAGALIDLSADTAIVAADLTAGTTITANSGAGTTIATATAGGSIVVLAGGPAVLGTLQAAVDLGVNAAAISLASGIAGRDISLASPAGDVTVTAALAGDDFSANAGGVFTGGTVTATGLGTDNDGGAGTFGGSAIVVDAGGNLRLDDGDAPARIQLASATGSVLSAGTLRSGLVTANAALDVLLGDVFAVDALTLTTLNGDIAGNLFDSDGDIILNASDGVTLAQADSGGSITVVAGGPAALGTFVATGDIAASASTMTFAGATAGGDVTLGATGDLVLGAAQAGDDFVANAGSAFTGGSVRTTGAGADSEAGVGALAGSNIVVDSVGDLRLDTGSSPGLIDLASTGGSILSNGTLDANQLLAAAALDLRLRNVNVATDLALAAPGGAIAGNRFVSAGDIDLDAATTITLAEAVAGGGVEAASGGDLRLDRATAAGDIDLDSGGSVLSGLAGTDTVGSLTAGGDILADADVDILVGDIQAGSDIDLAAVRNVSLRNAGAGDTFQLAAGANADFRGAVTAPAISATSANIAISPTGALGGAGTQTVTLAVQPTTQQTVLGGSSEGPGYTLTDAEADRIRAATLTIQAPANGTAANRAPDLLVRDLSLAGQAIGTLQVTTPGILQVEGNLLLAGVQPQGGIRLTATERLQVVNPTGSVRVRDDAGLADGNLLLFSNNIWSAPQALLAQLVADSNFAGRDEALLDNQGPVEPSGYIEAGTVVLSARDSLFVQNSGTLTSFAGITVRENTLRIVPTGTLPLRVFAFGRRINPDGSAVTNIAFFNEVVYQGRGGPVGYADDAQFNLCFINTGICRLPDPDNNLPGGPDIIEQPVDVGFTVRLPGTTDDLVDTSFADEPLIEEPVTSGGDSILWDCDNDDDGDCDEDDYDG